MTDKRPKWTLRDRLFRDRCRYISPSPWGPAQCVLPRGHEERGEPHAFSPSEAIRDRKEPPHA
jgi:hypothetical protein